MIRIKWDLHKTTVQIKTITLDSQKINILYIVEINNLGIQTHGDVLYNSQCKHSTTELQGR